LRTGRDGVQTDALESELAMDADVVPFGA
jgi:hypothetical protein